MSKNRKRGWKRRRHPKNRQSSHASLAALAPVIASKQILDPIHQQVQIDQKTVDYRPTDKLVIIIEGSLSN